MIIIIVMIITVAITTALPIIVRRTVLMCVCLKIDDDTNATSI